MKLFMVSLVSIFSILLSIGLAASLKISSKESRLEEKQIKNTKIHEI